MGDQTSPSHTPCGNPDEIISSSLPGMPEISGDQQASSAQHQCQSSIRSESAAIGTAAASVDYPGLSEESLTQEECFCISQLIRGIHTLELTDAISSIERHVILMWLKNFPESRDHVLMNDNTPEERKIYWRKQELYCRLLKNQEFRQKQLDWLMDLTAEYKSRSSSISIDKTPLESQRSTISLLSMKQEQRQTSINRQELLDIIDQAIAHYQQQQSIKQSAGITQHMRPSVEDTEQSSYQQEVPQQQGLQMIYQQEHPKIGTPFHPGLQQTPAYFGIRPHQEIPPTVQNISHRPTNGPNSCSTDRSNTRFAPVNIEAVPKGIGIGSSNFKISEIGFLAPDTSASADSVEITRGDTIYHEPLEFIERVREVIRIRGAGIVINNLSLCLRGTARQWYASLPPIRKAHMGQIDPESAEGWIGQILRNFAPSMIESMKKLAELEYTVYDADQRKSYAVYAYEVIKYCTYVGRTHPFDQLSQIYLGTDPYLTMGLPRPSTVDNIDDYIRMVDERRHEWSHTAKALIVLKNQGDEYARSSWNQEKNIGNQKKDARTGSRKDSSN